MRRPEAATYLGVHKSFLDKLAITDHGPKMVRMAARAIAYRKCDLDDWAASRVVSSSREPLPN